MAKPVLIVGAGGFIGSAIARALMERGDPVLGTSRNAIEKPAPGVRYITTDLSSPELLSEILENCRTVIYAAASSTPGSSAGKPVEEIDHHLRPLASLLAAMQTRSELPLLYLSSAGSLYGDGTDQAFTENHHPMPRSYHGASKAAAELYIHAWSRQYSGKATILRPSNVYGPGQNERQGFGIIPAAFGTIQRGETLKIWGDGSAKRDYLYIDDLVDLAIRAILPSATQQQYRVLNAASGHSVSLNELMHLIQAVTGVQPKHEHSAPRSTDANEVWIDARKAQEVLDWKARTSLKPGLENTWRWLTSNQ